MKYSILCTVCQYDGHASIQLTRTFDDTGFERIYASNPGKFPATLGAEKFTRCPDSYGFFSSGLTQTSMSLPWYKPQSVLSFIELSGNDPMYQYNQEILAFWNAVKDEKFLPSGSGTYCTIEVTDDSQIAKVNDLFNRLGMPQVVNTPGNIELFESASVAAQVQAPAALATNTSPGGPAFK